MKPNSNTQNSLSKKDTNRSTIKIGSFQKLFLLIAVIFVANLNAKAVNYYTITAGDYNDCAIWIPSCPDNTIDFGDSVFINHDLIGFKSLKVEGVLTISTSGSLNLDGGIQIEDIGYMYNHGYLNLIDELHVDGYFINTDKAEVLEVHSDGNVCNSDSLIVAPGETYRNHGGLLECCGVLITDFYEGESNSQESRVTCQTICNHQGKEPFIEIGGNQVSGDVALLNLDPTESVMTSPGANFCPPFLLPIEIISFTATVTSERAVQLKWVTASELNNDYFTIERSFDLQDWAHVEYVNGAGTSTERNNYSIIDEVSTHGNIYYRLTQTDFDGTRVQYEVRTVEIEADQGEFIIYPNPANDKATISGSFDATIDQLQIIDLSGKDVTSKVVIEYVQNGKIELNLNELQPGMYIVRIGESIKKFKKN